MGLLDRDYMRRSGDGSWWGDRSPQELIGITILIISLLSSVVWFAHDLTGVGSSADIEPSKRSIRVNINTATNAELQSLPEIGESRAQLIIAHRPYQSVDELAKLHGIGASLTEDLRPFLKTDGRTEKLKPAQ